MNFDSLPSFDPWDQFDDIPPIPTTNVNQYDDLLAFLPLEDACHLPNNCSAMVQGYPSSMTDFRPEKPIFDPHIIDTGAQSMISDGTLYINMETKRMDDWPFPWDNPFEGTNSTSGVSVCSPTDNSVLQPFSYYPTELHFQPRTRSPPIPQPSYGFGSAQTVSYVPDAPLITPTYDVEMPVIKKPGKRKQNLPSRIPPADPSNLHEWYIRDENGRQRRPLLFEFIRNLLSNHQYSDIAAYVDKRRGIFKFYQREKAAQLWGLIKGRNGSSSKFSRIIIELYLKIYFF